VSPRRLGAALAAGLAAAVVAAPAPAAAHGLVGRTDLPMPQWLFAWAACIVLVLSFVALAALWRTARMEGAGERALGRIPRRLEPAAGGLGIALFAFVVWCGLAGAQDPVSNLTPTVVWVLLWVGVAFASALLGNVFGAVNPWRAAARGVAWAAARAGVARRPRPYPARLGYWPAALGLLAFAWCELGLTSRDDPAVLAWLMLAYAAAMGLGMWVYGIEAWCRRADPLGVYFALLARLAPLGVRGRTLVLRAPLTGTTALEPAAGLLGVLVVMLGSTTFDGFSNGGIWADIAGPAVDGLGSLGIGSGLADELLAVGGLALCVLVVAALYRIGIGGMAGAAGMGERELGLRFAHTLLPIAAAYVVAHYFSLLLYQGQASVALASDPLGRGADVLGTATWAVDYGVISAAGIWYVQVAALVLGHVGGLLLAHDRALVLWRGDRAAVTSQYWMLGVMVGFTSLGLWLLSSVGT
jgi:hypothetical protein